MADSKNMFWGGFSTGQASDNKLRRHPEAIEMSRSEMFLASCSNILRNVYGFTTAVEKGYATDAAGRPLPLFTYPAIEYLQQFNYSDKTIFEYGAGGSTLFWQQRAKTVLSVENNPGWYTHLKSQISENVQLHLVEGDEFPWFIEGQVMGFDVIIIDSAGYRYDCASAATKKLKKGGLVILDNADWHPNTAAFLRDQGLLQVDMTGFKPGECHTSTTSLFFHRDFNFSASAGRQPHYGMGAKLIHSADWDKPYAKRQL